MLVKLIETVIFPWFGISLLIAAAMLFCGIVGINVSERVSRVLAGIAVAPILIFLGIAGVALVARVIP